MVARYPTKYINYDIINAKDLRVGDEFVFFTDWEGFHNQPTEVGVEVTVDAVWKNVYDLNGVNGPGLYAEGSFYGDLDRRIAIRRRMP